MQPRPQRSRPRAPPQVQPGPADDDRNLRGEPPALKMTAPGAELGGEACPLLCNALLRTFPRLTMSVAAWAASLANSPAENSSVGSMMSIWASAGAGV